MLDRYERLVFSIPCGYELSREDAADISQLTFSLLFEGLYSLTEDSNLGAGLRVEVLKHSAWAKRTDPEPGPWLDSPKTG